MRIARTSRTVRAALLTSVAGFCLTIAAGSAQAATGDQITDGSLIHPLLSGPGASSIAERQSVTGSMTDIATDAQDRLGGGFSIVEEPTRVPTASILAPQSAPITTTEEPQLIVRNPGTSATDRDPSNVTGIGQMIVDEQNGFIGLCTGTLINPRTVIFAAHCVNERPANSYGQDSGGQPIGFGFQNNNNIAGASAFGGWLGNYATNTARYMYDVNYVAYNPASLNANARGFLYSDVAVASFDTPAANIPTWALLFSQLPPLSSGANGTGYHVVVQGYGDTGTGATGDSVGIDFRRRIAENTLGALASLDDVREFLGGAPQGLTQNLYWTDFDSPGHTDQYDINIFRDNALPNEGMTAQGDSGGPLIIDKAYAKQLVIAVLSGNQRYFNGQPSSSYGTASFYQPLYLYWDWIAANNPYHYVSAKAGNGSWTDPTHWVTNLDPNYMIIDQNGNLVNNIPTAPGGGTTNTDGKFGEICIQQGGYSDCYNLHTGDEEYDPSGHPAGTGATQPAYGTSNDKGAANTSSLGQITDETASQAGDNGSQTTNGTQQAAAAGLPSPTLANGLPGATNFVPDDFDGDRLNSVAPRYFDVTLSATGATTLNSTVTVDRLTLWGAGAMLDVQAGGTLNSWLGVTQASGTMQVNGNLKSLGDYLIMTGGVNGTGTITAPFFTSIAGTISPGSVGTAGTIGTLTFKTNLILASGTSYNLDLGANGVSDQIAVTANGAGSGQANLGGRLVLGISAATLRGDNTYTILTSTGGVSGKFIDPAAFSAILTPKLTYSANAVTLQIAVTPYSNVVDRTNPIQYSYALLLDRNRPNAANYDALYGPLDLQNQATIRSTLSALAPTTETLGQSLGIAGVDNWSGVIRTRIDGMQIGDTGGTLARYGAPTQVAANGVNAMNMGGMSAMGFGAEVRSDAQQPMVQEGVLPDSVNGFLAGGYLTGDSTAMTGILGRDDYTGWYAAGGLETSSDNATVGFALSYTRLDGTGALAGQSAHANLFQGTLYGKMNLGGATLDAMATAGLLDLHTRRDVNFVGTPYTLRGDSGNLVAVTEVGLSKDFDIGSIRVTPRAAGRASHIDFSREAETGGPMALMINRGAVNSVQARGGLTIAGTGTVKPFLNGTLVHDFMDRPAVLGANFVGGVGGNVLFALNGQDKDWAEVSGGVTYETGNISFSASAETTIERQDVSSQAYRGSVSIKF